MINKEELLIASLVGSKINLPRFSAVQNELMKHVLPPIPFLPLKNQVKIQSSSSDNVLSEDPSINDTAIADTIFSFFGVDTSIKGTDWQADKPDPSKMFWPLSFKRESESQWWLFPYEPMITISSKNNIIKRDVAKYRKSELKFEGTVKERWSRDDYEVTITGYLMGNLMTGSTENCFPKADFQMLRDYLLADEAIMVKCEPLSLLSIDYLVIEDFSFPFTKGENVQVYEIKAVSDFKPQLFITKQIIGG